MEHQTMRTPEQHLSEKKQTKKERREEAKRIQREKLEMIEQKIQEDYKIYMQQWEEEEEIMRWEEEQNMRPRNLTEEQSKLRQAIKNKRWCGRVRASSTDENDKLTIMQQRPRPRLTGLTWEEKTMRRKARNRSSYQRACANRKQSHLCPEADLLGPGDLPAEEVSPTADSSRVPTGPWELHTSGNSLAGAGRAGSVAIKTSPMSIGFLLNEQ